MTPMRAVLNGQPFVLLVKILCFPKLVENYLFSLVVGRFKAVPSEPFSFLKSR